MKTLPLYYKTRTLCPICNELVGGEIIAEDNRVYIERECPEHGYFKGLISSDQEWYEELPKYYTDGIKPQNRAKKELQGCPEDCGLCTQHSQIAGTLAIEILDSCNENCPTCLANNIGSFMMSVEDVNRAVEAGLKSQEFIATVTISGGEPTLHPDFFAILDVVQRPEVGRVSINTNGKRIREDENFVKQLAQYDNIYLSPHYDGQSAISLRGVSYEEQKQTIEILQAHEIDMVPVVLATAGHNDHELGKLLDELFINYSHVKSVMYSLMTYSGKEGRNFYNDPMNRLTIPQAIESIQDSSKTLKKSDFIPLPMANPMCASIGYFLVMDGEITPLLQFGEREKIVEYIKNGHFGNLTPEFANFIQESIYHIFSNADQYEYPDALLMKFKRLYKLLFPDNQKLTHDQRVKLASEHLRVVYLMQFMDSWSFDSQRLNRCSCQHAFSSGEIIPTCSFYCYHRSI